MDCTLTRHRAVVAYHFFPHYREGICQRLSNSTIIDCSFIGDSTDPEHGVEAIEMSKGWFHSRFHRARCFASKRWIWQPEMLILALSSRADSWILLSLPKNLSVISTAIAGRLLAKNVMFWAHGWIKNYNTPRGAIRKLYYRLASSLLLYGHRAKALAIEDGFHPDRLHVVYNSMNHTVQKELRAKPESRIDIANRAKYFAVPELPTLICTSRLTTQRDLPLAFKALSLLKQEGLDTNFLLLGDGPERHELQELARELRLNVHFFGACYDEATISRLMQLSNLTIAPGKVGLTAMHSLTYGVPVVTHSDAENQMPESEAVIDGWNGALFERNNVRDLANVIRSSLSEFSDIEQTRRRCYEVIDRFYNPDHQAMIIERAIRRLPPADDGWEEFVSVRTRQRTSSR